jgi:hypothetical protein
MATNDGWNPPESAEPGSERQLAEFDAEHLVITP